MSSFEVKAVELQVEPHPNADRLDLVRPVGTEYNAVAQKGRFVSGDLAVYVPEQAVVPEKVLKAGGFWDDEKDKGMLAGKQGDRVKAIKLRGALSQGILLDMATVFGLLAENEPPAASIVSYNGDLADKLGIVKYEPPIPIEMAGEVVADERIKTYTDIENAKKYPGVFKDGEEVVVTEKLHGTCTIISLVRNEHNDWDLIVSSKGLAGKGLVLIESDSNLYWRVAKKIGARNALATIASYVSADREVTLFGETLGVQDLKYGFDNSEFGFRAFDIRVDGRYADYLAFGKYCSLVNVERVPCLDLGPFDEEKIWACAEGKSTVADHVREGVVVKPLDEDDDPTIGRKILKFVGEGYLTRKGNATEYE